MKSTMTLFAGRLGAASALLLALTVLPAKAAFAQDVDVTGEWILTVESPNGTGSREVTFKQKGAVLTGFISSSMAAGELTGTVEGNVITFVAMVAMDSGAFDVFYSATLEDGILKMGSVDFGEYGAGSFTGVRKPPPGGLR
jgi:hypothetical protein